ncbi:unnamed protein product [Mytilus edulis]|uniref:DUF5641 domain-containing protein n=1 Tax=Mytilus edulis TaxID=6550 RepID=A0A8S3QWE5_MYTED|nr:unnamed protein product [Mytilus edulis]
MELMQDMSAEEFLLGFRRFIARWGNPKQIISDNGSQFKLASKTLGEAWNGVTDDSGVTANKLRSGRIQSKTPAKVGDIVLIKENLPRGSWKIGHICQLVVSRDGQIRSGKVMLPNKKTLNRALNMLYPIECEELDEGLKNSDTEKDTELINDNTSTTRERTQRQAARTAMKKIQEQLES